MIPWWPAGEQQHFAHVDPSPAPGFENIQLRASNYLALGLLGLHLIFLMLLWESALPLWLRGLLTLLTALHLYHELKKHYFRQGKWIIQSLSWHDDGRWFVTMKDNMLLNTTLVSSSRIGRNLLIIRFKFPDNPHDKLFAIPQTIGCVICNDMCDAYQFRQLKVHVFNLAFR